MHTICVVDVNVDVDVAVLKNAIYTSNDVSSDDTPSHHPPHPHPHPHSYPPPPANVVLAHVPVVKFDFSAKAVFLAAMLRRVGVAMLDPREVDDVDYYGNKRLELAGQLLALLFEDLFKRLNAELRKQAEAHAAKAGRGATFDAGKAMRPDIITYGLESAIASGEWLKAIAV